MLTGPCGSGKEATREAQNRGQGYRGVKGLARFGPGAARAFLMSIFPQAWIQDPGPRPKVWHPISGRCFPARTGEPESLAATSPSQGIGVTSFE